MELVCLSECWIDNPFDNFSILIPSYMRGEIRGAVGSYVKSSAMSWGCEKLFSPLRVTQQLYFVQGFPLVPTR